MTKKKIAGLVASGIIVFALVILGAASVTVVPAGHTGVVVNLGRVSDTILTEGPHIVVPFVTQVVKVDNRVLKAEVESTSASKDLQNVKSTISVNYRIGPSSAASVYQNLGMAFEDSIVRPAIQECVKAVTAGFTAEELITERQTVSTQMRESLAAKITPYGLNIEVFNVISFEFSDEFNAAIEAKQTAQQNALKAEQDLQRIKVEAEQKIEQARADAESYRLKNLEITENTLRMAWIEKWNGELPKVSSDSASSILDITDLAK